MRTPQKGQAALLPIAISGVLTMLAAVGSAFVTANKATDSKVYETQLVQTKVDAAQDSDIRSIKTSICIQNQNMKAMAAALQVNVTDDPTCR